MDFDLAGLLFESGPDKGKRFDLKEGFTYTGGSDPRCRIVVNDELIAPLHFRIKGVGGKFFIRDENTKSGTLINDERLPQAVLKPGDKVQVGATVFSFVEDTAKNGSKGKVIGGYEIIDRLGRGGMGTVYRAVQVSLNREVALKVLPPRLTRNPAFIRMFTAEARAAAALSHPNVIQVYDVGTDGNLHYYSMEFAEKGTVEELINSEEPIPIQKAAEIVRDAARGLLYAESLNLVHQDIKPQNLMIDKFDVTKIADMGLARSLGDSENVGGEIVGTPHFISPERIRRKELDIRSDIYSLGCTFYRLLTGKTPFHGSTTREILVKQIKEDPEPIRKIRSDVPENVCQIVDRMMRKDPDERYPGVAALLDDLEALSGKTKRKGLIIAAGLVMAALVAFLVFFPKEDETESAAPRDGTGDSSASKERDGVSEQKFAEKEMEVEELKASNALLQISDDSAPAERMKLYYDIASRFPGTRAAAEAKAKADEIREMLNLQRRKAEERLQAVNEIRAASETRIRELVDGKRFFEAMSAARNLGAEEGMSEDPDVLAIRSERVAMVQEAARSLAMTNKGRVEDLIEKKKFAEAKETLETAHALLSRPEGFGEETAFPLLDENRSALTGAMTDLEAARRRHRLSLLDGDLLVLQSWSDPEKERREILLLTFTIPAAAPALETPEYKGYADFLTTSMKNGASLMEKLKAAVARGTSGTGALAGTSITHSSRSEMCEILGFTEDGDGLRLLAGGSTIVNIPFPEFNRPEDFISLMEDRFPMEGQDLLALVRASLLLAAARASEDLTPLRDAISLYTEKAGCNEAFKKAASRARAPQTSFVEPLNRLLDKAASSDPPLSAVCSDLKKKVEREAAAMELFASAVTPFIQDIRGPVFRESADLFELLAVDYADTFFFRYAGSLTGGSRREGGHLMEFVP